MKDFPTHQTPVTSLFLYKVCWNFHLVSLEIWEYKKNFFLLQQKDAFILQEGMCGGSGKMI